MKPKKESADWYIAATHWLTAGFAIPFVLALVLGIPLTLILGKENIGLLALAFIILNILSIWLGVIYSSRYLNKTYVIKNADQIVILSTIYLVLVGGGLRAYKFVQTGVFTYEYIGFAVGVIIFYLISKKYIKNNS